MRSLDLNKSSAKLHQLVSILNNATITALNLSGVSLIGSERVLTFTLAMNLRDVGIEAVANIFQAGSQLKHFGVQSTFTANSSNLRNNNNNSKLP